MKITLEHTYLHTLSSLSLSPSPPPPPLSLPLPKMASLVYAKRGPELVHKDLTEKLYVYT
jgi:hypothetical protein